MLLSKALPCLFALCRTRTPFSLIFGLVRCLRQDQRRALCLKPLRIRSQSLLASFLDLLDAQPLLCPLLAPYGLFFAFMSKLNATEALHAPGAWLHAVENASDFETVTVLSQNGQLSEHIMMGLRLTEGLDIERLERFPDIPLNEQAVSELEALGMLWRREGRLGATMQGRLVLNSVIAELMPD